MHVLMATWDGGGTVPVELGVARRLIEAGHRVTVLAEPSMGADVAEAGADFRSWQSAPHRVQEALADWECATPLTLFPRLLHRVVTGPSSLYAADVLAVAARDTYDVAVVDVVLMGAMAATESLGLPTAVTMPGPYLRPTVGEPPFGSGLTPGTDPVRRTREVIVPRLVERLWDLGLRDLNATRRTLGLDPLDHVWAQLDRAQRVLVLTAESFDFPPGRRPAQVVYVGPVLDDPVWADAEVDLPGGHDPLVLVGTSAGRTRGAVEVLDRVIAAFAELPIRALVTTGPAVPLVPSPRPGIRVVPAAPHTRLLAEAALVVTHGGHGTVIKALAAGRPCLVLPLGRDQPDNAARVVAHGAGRRLRPSASAEAIAGTVMEMLGDPGYAARAGDLGRRIRAETDCGRIVTAVESLGG